MKKGRYLLAITLTYGFVLSLQVFSVALLVVVQLLRTASDEGVLLGVFIGTFGGAMAGLWVTILTGPVWIIHAVAVGSLARARHTAVGRSLRIDAAFGSLLASALLTPTVYVVSHGKDLHTLPLVAICSAGLGGLAGLMVGRVASRSTPSG